MIWTKAKIGERWTSGDYVISTYREAPSGKSGYRLAWKRLQFNDHYATFEDAARAAEEESEERV